MRFLKSNTILYCKEWKATVDFYGTVLKLPILFSTDWFVEFELSDSSSLSIADSGRTTVKSSGGSGITISIQVDDLKKMKTLADRHQLDPSPIKTHPWNAEVFYLKDPEGNRLEFWCESVDSL